MALYFQKFLPAISRRVLAVLPFAGALFAPALSAQTDPYLDAYWTAPSPCYDLFDAPPAQLSGGAPLIKRYTENDVQGHYALGGGAKLRLTFRDLRQSLVYGDSYEEAYRDIFTRKPLQDHVSGGASGHAVLADVKTRMSLTYKMQYRNGRVIYKIDPKTLVISLNSAVRALDWEGYASADDRSRERWDRHMCQSLHHELGHILIEAQAWEDGVAELLNLTAFTQGEFQQKAQRFSESIRDRSDARHDFYHNQIETMGQDVAFSGPYMTLPFDWLRPDRLSGAPLEGALLEPPQ